MASKRSQLTETINQDMAGRNLPQKTPPDADQGPTSDPLQTFSIRLPQSQKMKLQAHFKKELGLDMTSGIRMLITQYMRENRL